MRLGACPGVEAQVEVQIEACIEAHVEAHVDAHVEAHVESHIEAFLSPEIWGSSEHMGNQACTAHGLGSRDGLKTDVLKMKSISGIGI
ncbi:hypothetical protein E4U42_001916 [Claviceps africana]|uniref:Uncharacterized protein n=1 Tax=Claviceps africana TaxID=83212 RepID=A0A8K0NK38_9HYPO|nr:hypothetical protein E4U42_001916 [Claviceps africana]